MRRTQYTSVAYALVALSFALGVSMLLASCGKSQLRGGVLEPAAKAPEMVLTDQSGQPFALSAQEGKVVLLFFGYTSCPDVCPTTLADMAQVARKLGDTATGVQVAFVSVDPNDTPQKLAQYVKLFNPNFAGLTGSEIELQRAMKSFQVKAERRETPGSGVGYSIDHSAFTYVIDKQGRLRELINYGTPADDVVNDVQLLLNE
jgi:protein SCO1/2